MKKVIVCILLCGLYLISFRNTKSQNISTNSSDPFHWKWVYEEIERVESPDAKVDAVVVTGDVGATEATRTYIYIVSHNSKIVEEDRNKFIFSGDYVKNLKVVWKEMRFLEIHYDEARIFEFKNYWESQQVDDYHYHVEIRLFPKQDHSLPLNLRTW